MACSVFSLASRLSIGLFSSLLSIQAIAFSSQPEPYRVMTPNSFTSISVHEVYGSFQTPNSLYAPPVSSFVEPDPTQQAAVAQVKQQLIIAKTQALMARINPDSFHTAKILAEWLTIKPQLEALAQKQSEVEELLNYMTRLSSIANAQP